MIRYNSNKMHARYMYISIYTHKYIVYMKTHKTLMTKKSKKI